MTHTATNSQEQSVPKEPIVLRSHFTWSIESPVGECPFCGGRTVLVSHCRIWEPDEEAVDEALGEGAYDERFCDGVTTDDELTAHYCETCSKLTSVSMNTNP